MAMQEKPGTKRRRTAAAAARSAAAAYRANREDLEPLIRLVADVFALAALARGHRRKPADRGALRGFRQ